MRLGKTRQGFILAATLWILAAITLAAGFFALWTQRAVELARQEQEDLQGEIDIQSTQAVVLYLLATQRMTRAGLVPPSVDDEEVAKLISDPKQDPFALGDIITRPVGGELGVGDQPYSGVGQARFSMQDESGLLGLTVIRGTQQLENLLGLLEVPVEKRGPLIDKLLDYTDEDDLHRLNGAEASDYQKNELPPPPNRMLLTTWEARSVLGWNDLLGLWAEHKWPRLTSTLAAGRINLNTAPELVLKSLEGMDKDSAERIIQARKNNPFTDLRDVFRAAGRTFPYEELNFPFLCSNFLRLTFWYKGGQRMKEVHLELTPEGKDGAPWTIEYELTARLPKELANASFQTDPLPVFTKAVSTESQ